MKAVAKASPPAVATASAKKAASRGKPRAALAAAALVAILATACSAREPAGPVTELRGPDDVASATDGDAIDEPLMIALAQAKNFHRKADVYLQDGQVELAMTAVENVLAVKFPDESPEAQDVKLDARARLAKLYLARGELQAASDMVTQGLAVATRESFFVANLHTVHGEVLEARAAAAQEEAQARELRRQAIEALDRSIQINQQLQRELIEAGR